MRVSAMIRINPGMSADGRLMGHITDFARQVEARGFPGIWVGDSMGRGRPTLDSLQVLTALAAVTRRVELGIAVLQLPLRHPIELAHRVQTLQAMSNDRLILGVGSGLFPRQPVAAAMQLADSITTSKGVTILTLRPAGPAKFGSLAVEP